MKQLLILFALITITACASSIMKSYVGKDVREVMLDYGPPKNAFDMGDGRRAFQWILGSSYTTPTTVTSSGTVSTYGPTSWVNSNTTISGGQTVNSRCVYTLFGRWDSARNGWYVTEFKKPNLMCE